MKIKTSSLIGPALDWAVAKCENKIDKGPYGQPVCVEGELHLYYLDTTLNDTYRPSTDWAQGGPILTDARISRTIDHSGLWVAYISEGYGEPEDDRKFMQCDRSELVAGLRCYVTSELGDEVEVPKELL